ncbi:MAG: SOS response-associated peptidase [Fidelibacterota bacterium]|nr:MAG: SOS response-associated peptidase [Candidatus Neomarinimicrobiota bacterium]
MRLSLAASEEMLLQRFHLAELGRPYHKHYNLAPGRPVLVLVEREGTNHLAELVWGLIPADAHHAAVGAGLFQVRQESLLELEAMRERLEKRRCAVVADGFFLWQKSNQGPQPWYIYLKDNVPFGLAAVWEVWGPKGEEPVYSCAIVTTTPNELVAPIHHRMPVILSKEGLADWLNRDKTLAEEVLPLCVPYPAAGMEAHKVGPLIDNEDADTIEVTDPVI